MRAPTRDRAAAGLLSGALVSAIGWALILGLDVEVRRAAGEALQAFDLTDPPPPPPARVAPPPVRSARPEGRAAPPNIRSNATALVAPLPVVPLPVPPPVVAAPVAHTGSDATQGAADRVGPGQGAGGEGDGFGGGGRGDGDGGGEGAETPPRLIRGRFSNATLPEYLRDRDGVYALELRYSVEADGRVTGCRAVRPSGWPELDQRACRTAEDRFRFRPALDGAGRPVRSAIVTRQEWEVEGEPDPEPRR